MKAAPKTQVFGAALAYAESIHKSPVLWSSFRTHFKSFFMFRTTDVSATLESHLIASPPDKLYHYTSSEALHAIVTHEEIWCTDASFLNDSSELLHTIEVAKTVIQGKIEAGASTLYSEGVIALLEEIIVEIDVVKQQATYIASFTRLPDDLSQWRAYSPASGGYAIGFPSIQLADMINKIPSGLMTAVFAECIYELVTQKQIISEIIDEIAKQFIGHFGQSIYVSTFNGGPFMMLPFKVEAIDYIQKLAPLFKHSSFKDEKEWRFVGILRSDYWIGRDSALDKNLGFRPSAKGIVPFYRLQIADTENPYLGKRDNASFSVRIGPAPDMANRQKAMTKFLQFYLGKKQEGGVFNSREDFIAELSTIPYKNW